MQVSALRTQLAKLTAIATEQVENRSYLILEQQQQLILNEPVQADEHNDELFIKALALPVMGGNIKVITTDEPAEITELKLETMLNILEELEAKNYTVKPIELITPELLSKHFKGVRFKEITTDEQTFVDRVLATCFNDTDSSASWITKVEEARTDREEWYYIHGKTTKTDFVLNGVCVRTALNYWNPDLDTDLTPELADHFLKDCLYGPDHRRAN